MLPHARAIARALGAPLTFLRVLEGEAGPAASLDPLEWELRRREAKGYLDRFVEENGEEGSAEAELLEGRAPEEICLWARQHGVALTALCTHGRGGRSEWPLASTARKVVEGAPGSTLLVPVARPAPTRSVRYRRLLVPLDGSSRAESVLRLARRLARTHRAELLLAHVVPEAELVEIGPPDPEASELRDRLVTRNERVAKEYLDRVRAQLAADDFPVRALALRGGDAGPRLARLIADEEVDLVVLSSHGRSARGDVSLGSVSGYLATHAVVPLLIVRTAPSSALQRAQRTSREAPRLPPQAWL